MAIYWDAAEHEYKHWCGNCQIRIYIQRHYGRILTWQDCPYTCEYATAMRCSTETNLLRHSPMTEVSSQYDKGYADGRADRDAEIVRCKYCAHHEDIPYTTNVWCEKVERLLPEDWFCADGERGDDEDR